MEYFTLQNNPGYTLDMINEMNENFELKLKKLNLDIDSKDYDVQNKICLIAEKVMMELDAKIAYLSERYIYRYSGEIKTLEEWANDPLFEPNPEKFWVTREDEVLESLSSADGLLRNAFLDRYYHGKEYIDIENDPFGDKNIEYSDPMAI